MVNNPGYCIDSELHIGTKTLIYRGFRDFDRAPIVVKVLKNEVPTARDLARLRHEFDILRGLDVSGAVRAYALQMFQQGLGLVLGALDGQTLDRLLRVRRLSLKESLQIGTALADLLGRVHRRGVVHKDIRPQTVATE